MAPSATAKSSVTNLAFQVSYGKVCTSSSAYSLYSLFLLGFAELLVHSCLLEHDGKAFEGFPFYR